MNSSKVPVSLLVPCKNEEKNIERCLRSVKWVEEAFVVDSQSTDRTISLAEQEGAQVVQFNYRGGWPKKKNWALDNLPFKNEWVLILDADECLPPEAEEEIRKVIEDSDATRSGYWINRPSILRVVARLLKSWAHIIPKFRLPRLPKKKPNRQPIKMKTSSDASPKVFNP